MKENVVLFYCPLNNFFDVLCHQASFHPQKLPSLCLSAESGWPNFNSLSPFCIYFNTPPQSSHVYLQTFSSCMSTASATALVILQSVAPSTLLSLYPFKEAQFRKLRRFTVSSRLVKANCNGAHPCIQLTQGDVCPTNVHEVPRKR